MMINDRMSGHSTSPIFLVSWSKVKLTNVDHFNRGSANWFNQLKRKDGGVSHNYPR